jgi:hypothetical protein
VSGEGCQNERRENAEKKERVGCGRDGNLRREKVDVGMGGK